VSTDPALRDAVEAFLDANDDGVLPIVRAGHPVLRQVAAPYSGQLGDLFPRLVEAMRVTMLAAPGVGLAAPQVGIGLAVAVLQDAGSPQGGEDPRERVPLDFRVLVNPSYEQHGDESVSFYEGCLSVPGYQAVVPRARSVRLTGEDETGRLLDEVVTGWPARIVQHETDHLRGELYVDHAHTRSLTSDDTLARLWAADPVPREAAARLGFPLG
jgi:peptide deformylase